MVEVKVVVLIWYLVEIVVVGPVKSGSLIGQKFKKYVKDIGIGSRSHDNNFTYMTSLKDVHEWDDLLQKNYFLSIENSDIL